MLEISTVGLDLAKNVFPAHGADASGQPLADQCDHYFEGTGRDLVSSGGRWCTTLIAEESHCGSIWLDRLHDEAIAHPLPHDELAHLHGGATQVLVAADFAGQEDDPLAPPDGSTGRPAVFSDAVIQFCLTIKGEGHPKTARWTVFSPERAEPRN